VTVYKLNQQNICQIIFCGWEKKPVWGQLPLPSYMTGRHLTEFPQHRIFLLQLNYSILPYAYILGAIGDFRGPLEGNDDLGAMTTPGHPLDMSLHLGWLYSLTDHCRPVRTLAKMPLTKAPVTTSYSVTTPWVAYYEITSPEWCFSIGVLFLLAGD